MQMLSSSVPCPRCGAHAMVTVFGPTGAAVGQGEITFSCPNGDEMPGDMSRDDVLAAWTAYREPRRQAS